MSAASQTRSKSSPRAANSETMLSSDTVSPQQARSMIADRLSVLSCPGLSRASTCCFDKIEGVDGRAKPGHDDGEGGGLSPPAIQSSVRAKPSASEARNTCGRRDASIQVSASRIYGG